MVSGSPAGKILARSYVSVRGVSELYSRVLGDVEIMSLQRVFNEEILRNRENIT